MRLVELKNMKDSIFAIPPDNIREVCPVDTHTIISTYDGNFYDCLYSFEHVVNLINNAFDEGMKYVTTINKRAPSCE